MTAEKFCDYDAIMEQQSGALSLGTLCWLTQVVRHEAHLLGYPSIKEFGEQHEEDERGFCFNRINMGLEFVDINDDDDDGACQKHKGKTFWEIL